MAIPVVMLEIQAQRAAGAEEEVRQRAEMGEKEEEEEDGEEGGEPADSSTKQTKEVENRSGAPPRPSHFAAADRGFFATQPSALSSGRRFIATTA